MGHGPHERVYILYVRVGRCHQPLSSSMDEKREPGKETPCKVSKSLVEIASGSPCGEGETFALSLLLSPHQSCLVPSPSRVLPAVGAFLWCKGAFFWYFGQLNKFSSVKVKAGSNEKWG